MIDSLMLPEGTTRLQRQHGRLVIHELVPLPCTGRSTFVIQSADTSSVRHFGDSSGPLVDEGESPGLDLHQCACTKSIVTAEVILSRANSGQSNKPKVLW